MALALTLYYRKDQNKKWIKAIAYIVAGYSTAPGIYRLAYQTPEHLLKSLDIVALNIGGALYAFGAVIYAAKIPERFVPKKFDIWLNSHSIFHWMILAASMLNFWSSLKVFHER